MEHVKAWLAQQEQNSKLRRLFPVERDRHGRLCPAGQRQANVLDFSSNDYLALSQHPEVIEGARQALATYGAGAGAARLMSGDLSIHHRLEEQTASLKGKEASLLFGSGYLANIGVIPSLVGRNDVIFTDRLNHASIYDGCLLSGARVVRFRHNDLAHLEQLLQEKRGVGRALVVVESLYSMDGDFAPLKELAALKKKFGALIMVDEAHATGLFGVNGAGWIEQEGVAEEIDLIMGTYGKALGSYGAFVAADREMISYLVNRARSFIYSTALPPAVVGASLAALKVCRKQPELRAELLMRAARFKDLIGRELQYSIPDLGMSQIIPLPVGDSGRALALAGELRERGVFATAIRPPTVPEGSARIRLSVTLFHSEEDLERVAKITGEIFKGAAFSPR